MRSINFVVERDPDTGLFVGHVPGWPGAHSQGESLDELQRNLGTRVRLEQRGEQGYLAIEFYDRGDLHRVLDLLVQGST